MKEQVKVLDNNYLQLKMLNSEQCKGHAELEMINKNYKEKIINIENLNLDKDNNLCSCHNEIEQLKCCVVVKSKNAENC